ncbi:hypothetical protein MMPV_004035 [Pyropia vietnamensis]
MQMEGGGGAAAAAAFAVAAAEAAKADATARAAANAAADAADDAVDVDEVWALYRCVFGPGPADGTVAGGGSGGGGGGGGGGGRDGLAALGRSTATAALPADGARVGVPLGILVRGVELVLGTADEWHRHFAAPALRLDGAMRGLAAAAAAWQGVEFASWPKLLAARAATAAGRAAAATAVGRAAAYFP